MADLGHGSPELRQPFLLPQRAGQVRLHRLQRLFRDAQLLDIGSGRDHAAGVFGRLGIGLHVQHDPADRHHQKPPHGQEQQERGHDRDQRRQHQDAQPVLHHRRAQGRGLHRDLDQRAGILHRIADHPDDAVLRIGQHGKGIADQFPGAGFAQVERAVNLARHGRGQDQLAHLVSAQDDVEDLGVDQKLGFEFGHDHALGRKQGQRGDLRLFQPGQQKIGAIARDRGHEDQDLGQHDKDHRQDQEPPRKRFQKACSPFRHPDHLCPGCQGIQRCIRRTIRCSAGLLNNFGLK